MDGYMVYEIINIWLFDPVSVVLYGWFMVWFVMSSHMVGLVVVILQVHTVAVMLVKYMVNLVKKHMVNLVKKHMVNLVIGYKGIGYQQVGHERVGHGRVGSKKKGGVAANG
eukprot:463253_1